MWVIVHQVVGNDGRTHENFICETGGRLHMGHQRRCAIKYKTQSDAWLAMKNDMRIRHYAYKHRIELKAMEEFACS